MSNGPIPQHVLIIGAGVFGLSTALSILHKPEYKATGLTIVDASPSLPNPEGSSVDASRIVRADYAYRHYSRLALEAQELWRDKTPEGWGGEGRYYEPGFVLTADEEEGGRYVKESLATVRELAAEDEKDNQGRRRWYVDVDKIKELRNPDEIRAATGYDQVSGDYGYANFNSGWADAEKCVAYALRRLRQEGGDRVTLRSGAHVARLLVEPSTEKCTGVELVGGEQIHADLTILAAGAWSPTLIDLQGRCLATGQAIAYVNITDEEVKAMQDRPTIMNLSRGMFIIPPRTKELKIARHGFGYMNPVKIPRKKLDPGFLNNDLECSEEGGVVEVSVPKVGTPIPLEGQKALREALRGLVPHMAERPFSRTRICWYCDTPTGDFLITFHPRYKGLFIATGGSGHGFKFFPVIGDKIVDAIQGTLDPELAKEWRWRTDAEVAATGVVQDFIGCEDGSRAGPKGMILEQELARKDIKPSLRRDSKL
ncbi:Amino acid oxidase imqH [Exophiala dermatitidis]